jgi:cytochrome c
MKKKTVFLTIILSLILPLTCTLVFAEHLTPAERGKTHFDNSEFAGGNKACNSCHPNGRGLEEAGTKSSFAVMGGQQASLEEAINMCIAYGNKGDVLKVTATEIQEIVSYIKSLSK